MTFMKKKNRIRIEERHGASHFHDTKNGIVFNLEADNPMIYCNGQRIGKQSDLEEKKWIKREKRQKEIIDFAEAFCPKCGKKLNEGIESFKYINKLPKNAISFLEMEHSKICE